MLELSPDRRRELRAAAHHLQPVVMIGHGGLSASVLKEIDVNLRAHELIKIRVLSDDRAGRDALLAQVCDALDAAPVQHIGKLLVVWRPAPEEVEEPPPRRPPGRSARAPSGRSTRALSGRSTSRTPDAAGGRTAPRTPGGRTAAKNPGARPSAKTPDARIRRPPPGARLDPAPGARRRRSRG